MRRRALVALGVVLSAGCSDDVPAVQPPEDAGADTTPEDAGADTTPGPVFTPSDKQLLSTGNLGSNDEDPCVVRAQDGRMFIAYFSNRAGNADIYVERTDDGTSWTEARVTTSAEADFYPHLHQDEAGRFHITWFRWIALEVGSIWYSSSPDGLTWDPASEVQVTTDPDVDDWVPTVASAANGDVLIYFASKKRNPTAGSDLFMSRKPAGQDAWEPPVPVTDLDDPVEHDTMPHVVRTGPDLELAFVRSEPTAQVDWADPSADVYLSTSTDGVAWSPPKKVTDDAPDNVVDTLPGLFPDHAGAWGLVWISLRTGKVEASVLALADVDGYPEAAKVQPIFEGYSPRMAPTPTPGVFLGVWVEPESGNPDDAKDVYYRFFED